MKDELYQLVNKERPEIVQIVNWAAGNGDRSENGDYLYGKRRMREIDRRIRFLTKRLEAAVVVDPELREATDQVFSARPSVCCAATGASKPSKSSASMKSIPRKTNFLDFAVGALPD
ncbi:transcription elongation factor GreB [Neisseria gonorrhoeae]|uniref:Transcription elongation factor GreA n=1 Tax=Neisseria gonorrhoeae TaxID=485 RepID=A0A378W1Y3_NEIGO|nr:transcription elongation factor GreB [Neisseria gonorrhoeae]